MSKKLDEKDYREHLREQIYFLQSSAKLYDLGTEFEAKRMAISVRVLTRGDAENSRNQALLGQMHLKKKMNFVSTARPYNGKNLLAEQLLLQINFKNGNITYVPAFENSGCLHMLKYPDWESEVVLTDKRKRPYRRKDIIKLLADKDGGAHVDSNIPDRFAPMKDIDIGGWQAISSGSKESYGNNPVYASMRQMTFEMLQSLYLIRPQLFLERYF